MKCTKCGCELVPDSKFCPSCGAQTPEGLAEQTPAGPAVPSADQPTASPQPTAYQPYTAPAEPAAKPRQSFFKTWWVWATACGVIFVVMLAIIIQLSISLGLTKSTLGATVPKSAAPLNPAVEVTPGPKTTASPKTTPAAAEPGLSRKNPAALNQPVAFSVTGTTKYSGVMTATEIIRGAAAWDMILAENQFNDPPAEGYEYILTRVQITVTSVEGDKAVNLSDFDFKTFSAANEEYDTESVVNPKPEFDGKLYAEGSKEGYIVSHVKIDDANPKLVYRLGLDGSGGIWFSLGNTI